MRRGFESLEHFFAVEVVGVADGLLDDVAGELVQREGDEVVLHGGQHRILLLDGPVLHHILHDVVPELALAQRDHHLQQPFEDDLEFVPFAVLQELLDHAAAIGVECQLVDLL